jgi:hypothetical protein
MRLPFYSSKVMERHSAYRETLRKLCFLRIANKHVRVDRRLGFDSIVLDRSPKFLACQFRRAESNE